METSDYVQTLERDGLLLADAAEKAGPDAPVPSCPEWRVRDLVLHMGQVHRWAADLVARARTEPVRFSAAAPELADEDLVPWLQDGHRALVETLRSAAPDMTCWTFMPATSPLAFWARRQAHETAVHRVDAEGALGVPATPPRPGFAVDGIEEILLGFHSQERSRVRTERPTTVQIRATDVPGAAWSVHLSSAPPRTERISGAAVEAAFKKGTDEPNGANSRASGRSGGSGAEDEKGGNGANDVSCVIQGTAAELYLFLWNRLPLDAVRVIGDMEPARLWQDHSAI
ncbi:maleylpyruvate isomerase family mycothiol-dependent enzyme [Streptomyces sp. MST-110588]|uniref:maleylpyruvate isomerase family mycothiol-dependent enzyme n=1 Tax=Streptomyces sp. MST-110588 TaxID=2833628 RepID=UPI001F5D5AD1|nr:maleylpyruvate isomerase family mycothiol-dependent enzyme [Streptomyces sp. MST-110588]UNO38905.1 maleylpyruvate isomerase family mycothiol-dependent enzyme [Streptomyces sp. MST-110588]